MARIHGAGAKSDHRALWHARITIKPNIDINGRGMTIAVQWRDILHFLQGSAQMISSA
jgi:hypothetical protein